MVKLALASTIVLVGLGGGLAAWHVMSGEPSELASVTYKAKIALGVTVPGAQTKEFLAIVEELAAADAFELQHNLSGLPLKDGRAIIYLVFSRSDGVEIRVANPFHPDDVEIGFYDKRETGAWKSVYDKFKNSIEGKFATRQAAID
jgi:hypothetical protein